ncbi:MAG: PAC2 family protein, partial [Nakamurella sp.]
MTTEQEDPMNAEPGDLYTLNPEAADGLGEPVLLVALDGYVDAGNGVTLAVRHLLQGADALTGHGEVVPDDGAARPDDGDAVPNNGGARPDDGGARPDDGAAGPDSGEAGTYRDQAEADYRAEPDRGVGPTPQEPAGDIVVAFDADTLIDYRSRRPPLTYSDGAFTAYSEPRIVIRRLTDAAGTPYLLLTGPEPDMLWERYCAAIIDLV